MSSRKCSFFKCRESAVNSNKKCTRNSAGCKKHFPKAKSHVRNQRGILQIPCCSFSLCAEIHQHINMEEIHPEPLPGQIHQAGRSGGFSFPVSQNTAEFLSPRSSVRLCACTSERDVSVSLQSLQNSGADMPGGIRHPQMRPHEIFPEIPPAEFNTTQQKGELLHSSLQTFFTFREHPSLPGLSTTLSI